MMSDPRTQPGEKPEPKMDPPPDDGPGGPADMVRTAEEDLPPATPDQPRAAQVDEERVPDEIEQPEESEERGKSSQEQSEKQTDEPS
jgi:hypothetical protein